MNPHFKHRNRRINTPTARQSAKYAIPLLIAIAFCLGTATPLRAQAAATPTMAIVTDHIENATAAALAAAATATLPLLACPGEAAGADPAACVAFSTTTTATPPLTIVSVNFSDYASGTTFATASAEATAAANASGTSASDTQSLKEFYDESRAKCDSGDFSSGTLKFILRNYNRKDDNYLHTIINDTIGCVAIAENDPKACGLYSELPASEKEFFDSPGYSEACVNQLSFFNTMRDAFKSPGACVPALREYCKKNGVCDNQPPGKVCTCDLYATMWCGIPEAEAPEQCDGLREKIAAVIEKDYGRAEADSQSDKVITVCKRAVLGFSPKLEHNDAGISQLTFLGGLFAGRGWPVFKDGASLSDYGVATSIAYWYHGVYKGKQTCYTLLQTIVKSDLCNIIAREEADAKLKEKKAKEKKDKEEKANKDAKEKPAAPDTKKGSQK